MARTLFVSVMVTAFLLCWGNQVQAAQEGDYTYTVTNGKAQITKYTGSSGAVNVPGTLGGVTVTSIGTLAFYECRDLTHVSIPDSVTDIDDYTFAACDGLTSVSIPDSVIRIGNYAFEGCEGLTSITLPANLTSMGRFSFNYCKGLISISIPESVTSIGVGAFRGCTGLTIITFNSSITAFEKDTLGGLDEATSDTITIPDSTKIRGYDPSTAKDYATKYNRTFEPISSTLPVNIDTTGMTEFVTTSSTTVSSSKEWTIKLNGLINENSIANNIYVANSQGFQQATTYTVTNINGTSQIKVTPTNGYTPGDYTLFIRSIESTKGIRIKNQVYLKFLVQ